MKPFLNPRGSLESRITAAGFLPVAVATAGTVVLFAVLLVWQLRSFEDELRLRARSIAESLSRQSELALLLGDHESLQRLTESVQGVAGVLYCGVRGANGEWLAAHSAAGANGTKRPRVVEETVEVRPSGAGQVMDWDNDTQQSLGAIRVALSAEKYETMSRQSLWSIGAVGVVALLMILRLQLRQIRKVLQPLQSLIEFTRRVADGDLSQRAAVAQRDEVGRLAMACNEMVSKIERSQTELMAALDAAKEASRLKSQFLANMSHEIRTPLNGVIGMTELALETQLAPDAREQLNVSLHSAHSLLRTLNDILDLSKIEAGKLSLDCAAFDLERELAQAAKAFARQAHQKGVEILCDFAPDLPRQVRGDAHRLGQVLANLLSNAVKFTSHGEIALSARVEDESAGGLRLRLEVSDTGIGIAPEKLSAIFEPFTQADGSMSRVYGGTGLGLAICRRLTELMGGSIEVSSRVGEGSRFSLTAVFETVVEAAAQPPATFTGRRALVIDPHPGSRRILGESLASMGVQARLFASRDEGRAALNEGAFDVLVADSCLRGQCAEMVGAVGERGPALIIAAQAGSTHERACRKDCRAAACVSKPIAPSDLRAALAEALTGAARQSAQPDPARRSGGQQALRILVAEDNLVNEKVLRAWLTRAGHTVRVAHDGAEAVAAAEADTFDLILMDVQMPGMDGLAATRAIRQRETTTGCRIPIVALTAHALNGDREVCLEAGMDGYVTKPIRTEELFAAIRAAVPVPDQEAMASKSIA